MDLKIRTALSLIEFFANACWFTSITFAESTDVANCRHTRSNQTPLSVGSNATPNTVGACYMHNDQLAIDTPNDPLNDPFLFPPSDLNKHIVGAIPYQYYRNWGCTPTDVPPDYGSTYQGGPCGRHGYKEHSSVVKARPGEGSSDMANKYFTIAAVSAPIFNSDSELANLAQKPALCLLQTNDLGNPDSWLGWNGRSFAVDLRSGYNLPPGGNPDNHVCEAAVPGMSAIHPWSLTYNRYLKKYML